MISQNHLEEPSPLGDLATSTLELEECGTAIRYNSEVTFGW